MYWLGSQQVSSALAFLMWWLLIDSCCWLTWFAGPRWLAQMASNWCRLLVGDQCWPEHFATQIVNAVNKVNPGILTGKAASNWLEQPTVSSILFSTVWKHIIGNPLNSWKDPMTFRELGLSLVWRPLEHHFWLPQRLFKYLALSWTSWVPSWIELTAFKTSSLKWRQHYPTYKVVMRKKG